MNFDRIKEKLEILADAAKYDVSCSSSGGNRKNKGGLGNSHTAGICHSFTEDGRCISLLKILLTNHCIYDCLYCVSRKSNDIKRAAFTVTQLVDLDKCIKVLQNVTTFLWKTDNFNKFIKRKPLKF